MAAQRAAEVIAVEIGGSGAADRSGSAWPNVRLLKMRDTNGGNLARARNHGARRARGDFLCFVDANLVLGEQFTAEALAALTAGEFICAAEDPGLTLCARTDYLAIDGYDEVLDGCEQAEWDIALRLQMLGRIRRPLVPGALKAATRNGTQSLRFRRAQDRLAGIVNASLCADHLFAPLMRRIAPLAMIEKCSLPLLILSLSYQYHQCLSEAETTGAAPLRWVSFLTSIGYHQLC